jgi:hypothetical protein
VPQPCPNCKILNFRPNGKSKSGNPQFCCRKDRTDRAGVFGCGHFLTIGKRQGADRSAINRRYYLNVKTKKLP